MFIYIKSTIKNLPCVLYKSVEGGAPFRPYIQNHPGGGGICQVFFSFSFIGVGGMGTAMHSTALALSRCKSFFSITLFFSL
jgi:hypothetical protein